jgi:phosphatidylserine decarboxylase
MKKFTNIVSILFGKFANTKFPAVIQNIINMGYVKFLGLDMSDFHEPSSYSSLNQLFTRELLKKREFSVDSSTYISPCDAFISCSGKIDEQEACQITGKASSVDELLTKHASQKKLVSNGDFINFYLSPKDYHRYHAPYDLSIHKLIYIPGKLYPVNFRYLNKKLNLFIENERVILECSDSDGKVVYLVFVGALNVGKMVFHFEPRVETNVQSGEGMVFNYNDIKLKKGEEIGYFKMGSTIVMITQSDYLQLENLENQKVSFGQPIAQIR